MATAGKDADHESLLDWGQTRRRDLQAYDEDQYQIAVDSFSQIADSNFLEAVNRPIIGAYCGETYRSMGRYEEALADFDRALELQPENDWHFYQRAITRRRLAPADALLDDLNAAIVVTATAHQATPINLLNLALYHVARGDAGPAETLYREGLAGQPGEALRKEAIVDLEQYQTLFPDDGLAGQMRALLVVAPGS